jgi:hypothetical protein
MDHSTPIGLISSPNHVLIAEYETVYGLDQPAPIFSKDKGG